MGSDAWGWNQWPTTLPDGVQHYLPPARMEVAPSQIVDEHADTLGEGHMPWAFMGYEQLLSIQQQQHQLELDQKDAEHIHLKTRVEYLEANRHPFNASQYDVAEMLRTQEEAATLLMSSKHKELELMVGLLEMREQQIEDFRKLCEAQNKEIQQLKQRRFGDDHDGVAPSGTSMQNDAERGGSSPSRPVNIKDEHHQLPREVQRLRLRMEELEATMQQQHNRSAGLAQELQVKSEEVKMLEEQIRVIRSPGRTWPGVNRSPNGGSPGLDLSPEFGAASGPSTGGSYVVHEAPVGSFENAFAAVPEATHAMRANMAGAATSGPIGGDTAADEAAEAAAAAFLLARSTERRVYAEAEAHAASFSPLQQSPRPSSPRQQSPRKQVQSPSFSLSAPSQPPPTLAGHGSTLDAMALRRIGDENLRQTSAGVTGPSHTMMSETMDMSVSHLNFSGSGHSQQGQSYLSAVRVADTDADPTPARSTHSSAWNAPPSEVAETSRQSQELLGEMRRLRLQMSELEHVAGSRAIQRQSQPSSGSRHPGSDTAGVPPPHPAQPEIKSSWDSAAATNSKSTTSVPSASPLRKKPEVSGWEYRPHASGDPTDVAVATLVNRPGRYRGWRALLCRLEQGVYLCGTRRVHLRADLVAEKIEASDDGGNSWSDLELVMKGAEASQRALLERARDAAGLKT